MNIMELAQTKNGPALAGVSTRIQPATKLRVQNLAAHAKVSVSDVLRFIIEKHIDAELKAARRTAK